MLGLEGAADADHRGPEAPASREGAESSSNSEAGSDEWPAANPPRKAVSSTSLKPSRMSATPSRRPPTIPAKASPTLSMSLVPSAAPHAFASSDPAWTASGPLRRVVQCPTEAACGSCRAGRPCGPGDPGPRAGPGGAHRRCTGWRPRTTWNIGSATRWTWSRCGTSPAQYESVRSVAKTSVAANHPGSAPASPFPQLSGRVALHQSMTIRASRSARPIAYTVERARSPAEGLSRRHRAERRHRPGPARKPG